MKRALDKFNMPADQIQDNFEENYDDFNNIDTSLFPAWRPKLSRYMHTEAKKHIYRCDQILGTNQPLNIQSRQKLKRTRLYKSTLQMFTRIYRELVGCVGNIYGKGM